jgi:hypothetical protein
MVQIQRQPNQPDRYWKENGHVWVEENGKKRRLNPEEVQKDPDLQALQEGVEIIFDY